MAHEAKLLEGKPLAEKIQKDLCFRLEDLARRKLPMPCLRAFQVSQELSSEWYLGQQKKLAEKLGIQYERVSPDQLKNPFALAGAVESAGRDPGVSGIFITFPLPEGFDPDSILLAMDPRKDVEGIHPSSLGLVMLRRGKLIPPTALAAFRLLESTGMELRGKKAAVVGQSAIVGRPLQMLLGDRRVTVTVCNSGTSAEDLQKIISESDIVVGCAGQPGLIRGTWIKQDAVVIDVGTTEVNGKLVGDVEFEAAREHASWMTPVPGGVGPLTVTLLMENLIKAHFWQHGL